jgi:hypothetical protein
MEQIKYEYHKERKQKLKDVLERENELKKLEEKE